MSEAMTTTKRSARAGIKPRMERWAKILDRYCEKDYLNFQEEADAKKIVSALRSFSEGMKI